MTKGEKIKQLREAKGMTQEDLAQALNTKRQTVSKYEKGIVTNIPSDRIEAIARILDSTPEYILGWEDVQKKNDAIVSAVQKMRNDPEFLDVISILADLPPEQYASVKTLLTGLKSTGLISTK